MKKYFSLALMCLATLVMFTACEPNNNNGNSKAGEWITNPSQLEGYVPGDTVSHCWQFDLWCDGTTIGREYIWAPESAIIFMIKMAQQTEMKVYGYYAKKYKYEQVEENTEGACTSRQWEGAQCWLITYYYKHKDTGEMVTEQEYFWAPEENAKERADYYKSFGAETGMVKYEYEPANYDDQDACIAQNPEDTTIVPPIEPKDYSQYDSVTYKCWKTEQTSYGMTITNYTWMTEKQLVMYYDQMGIAYTYEEADAADEDACNELKEGTTPTEGEEACWQITSTVMGQTTVSYYWGTESEAQAQVNAINGTGLGTASYVKAAADDADSCSALDE